MLNNPKLVSLETALKRRAVLRDTGKRLVVTNGCFDLLHAGHVYYLQEAAKLGDELWLLLNSDASVRVLKGDKRPVQSETHRAYVMSGLACITQIIPFASPRLDNELRKLEPDVYTKAGDYSVETINPEERAALEAVGADIRFLPFLNGFSTTDLMQRIVSAGGLS